MTTYIAHCPKAAASRLRATTKRVEREALDKATDPRDSIYAAMRVEPATLRSVRATKPRRAGHQHDEHAKARKIEVRIEARIATFTNTALRRALFARYKRRAGKRRAGVYKSDIFNALCGDFYPKVQWRSIDAESMDRLDSRDLCGYAELRLLIAFEAQMDEFWSQMAVEFTRRAPVLAALRPIVAP